MMGIKSTVDITREDAITEIRRVLGGATNSQIADALEMLVGDERLANYCVAGGSAECAAQAKTTVDDELFQERAAIREFDANLPRADAEILARNDLASSLYSEIRQ